MQKYFLLCAISLSFLMCSCSSDDSGTTIIVTEEVLFTSGEQARILGRLITNQPINASDHGFYIGEEESFSQPTIISLGEKKRPGKFVGEVSELKSGQSYYVKSFVQTGDGILFGNVLPLNTLSAGLESYSPSFGSPGMEILIIGRNFNKDTRVFFGQVEATVTEILFESRLKVVVPAIGDSDKVTIKITTQDQELTFSSPFEYQTGDYTLIGKFPDEVRIYDNVSFQNSAGFYVGLGSVNRTRFYEFLQRYNPSTETWDKISFPGSPRSFAFATENYLGGGIDVLSREPFSITRSFWKITTTGFQQLADLPFDSRESLAFEIKSELYVMGGKEGDGLSIRKYNPATASWTVIGTSPESFTSENAIFIYENNAYIVSKEGVLWRFDPMELSWDTISTYPGSIGQGYGIAKVVGSKVYVGLYRRASDFWELDLETFSWTSKNSVPGVSQSITVASFVKDDQIYVMRAPDITLPGNYPLELYRFNPSGF
ncbi:IPT/TIG domain-containing protein [Algoriphagus aquimarinus]|nr:IPT/TIG domain-containing protein [Algoriphagus aquimarinus]